MTGTMHILDAGGDTKLIWDPARPAEVESARHTFKELTAKGYKAFRVNKAGEKGTLLSEFDQDVEKMILTPPLRGG